MTKSDDDPISLATASADFSIPKGVLKAGGLRGELVMFKLGKQYYTSANAVREWVQQCRVAPKVRVSGSIRDENSMSSETERISSARAALMHRLS